MISTDSNIINDLGSLTKVPNKILSTLIDKEILCIGSAIHDAIIAGKDTTILNIGIGYLSVDLKDMQCKFMPNKDLKATIKVSMTDKIDPLEFQLEQELIDKLTKIYSDVL